MRASCIATLPRAAYTDSFRHTLARQEGDFLLERLRGISEKHPAQMAGDLLDAPPGLSLRHLSRKLTNPFILEQRATCGEGGLDSVTPSGTSGFAIFQVTHRPGRTVTMDMVSGSIACPASGRPLSLIQCFD